MKRYVLLALAAFTATACFDFFGPSTRNVSLNIVPLFDEFAAATLADNADQLRVIIERDSSGTFVFVTDTVLTIDPVTGEASGNIAVVLLENVQEFRIRLEAFRASDGAILFQGETVVSISASAAADDGTQTISIPIQYAGLRGTRVAIAPRDTAVLAGSTFQLRATVFDTLDLPIEVPLTFNLVNPRDSLRLKVARATGAAEAVSAGSEPIVVFVRTGDSLTDTTRVFVVNETDPVALRLDIGSATVAKDSTVQLSATLIDRTGTVVVGEEVNWTSRTSRVASVNATGLVQGLVPGTSVVVARARGFTDSLVVTVAADGRVVVTTTTEGRSFFESQLGGEITVDVTADMSFAGSELLGSYNATLTWNPSVLTLVAVEAGDFPTPEFNDVNAATGELRFAQVSPSGSGGSVVLARIRFSKVGLGTTTPTVAISEMSAAVTFTDLLSRVSVTNGTVTVN
ncbi:MAG: Ig-like domain-containing protein [Gemmatimonadetes bacterium]|nr:Ig-like domain-containing protein [Gemmatimonadota bacterium]